MIRSSFVCCFDRDREMTLGSEGAVFFFITVDCVLCNFAAVEMVAKSGKGTINPMSAFKILQTGELTRSTQWIETLCKLQLLSFYSETVRF